MSTADPVRRRIDIAAAAARLPALGAIHAVELQRMRRSYTPGGRWKVRFADHLDRLEWWVIELTVDRRLIRTRTGVIQGEGEWAKKDS